MGLSKPNILYGVHQISAYNPLTGDTYGTARVLGSANVTLAGEQVSLTGGSNAYPWDSQDGAITPEVSINLKEMPDFMIELLLGKAPTVVADDAGGVDALVNVNGVSVLDAVTGIDSVGVKTGSEADVKFSKYLVKVVSPTTVDVYAYTNVDFRRGTDKVYEDDLLKITATPLTITTLGVATEVPGFGVELIGGSGTIAMTADDTADFFSYPASLEKMNVRIGGDGDTVPEFGLMIAAQKQKDGTMWIFDLFRASAIGLPFNMGEKAYNEAEITLSLSRDEDKDGVFDIYRLKPAIASS